MCPLEELGKSQGSVRNEYLQGALSLLEMF